VESTQAIELICDIQPGALRQRYSVEWIIPQTSINSYIIVNSFNLTVNVSYDSSDSIYYCDVAIDHSGTGMKSFYEGRHITIVTTLSEGISLP
jgi:hypothetical protein